MNHGLKLLIYSFAIGTIGCILGCWYDNCHPKAHLYMAHVEIHADRDLVESIKEQARDEERRDMSKNEREYHEGQDRGREQEQNTDFGSMS